MSKKNKNKNKNTIVTNSTVNITNDQLETIIAKAVKTALKDLKEAEKLHKNEVNELNEAPATYTTLWVITSLFLLAVIVLSGIVIFACGSIVLKDGISLGIVLIGAASIMFLILSSASMYEIFNTKKIAVLQTAYSAIMALSSLVVASVGAYFAYKSTR